MTVSLKPALTVKKANRLTVIKAKAELTQALKRADARTTESVTTATSEIPPPSAARIKATIQRRTKRAIQRGNILRQDAANSVLAMLGRPAGQFSLRYLG